MAPPITTPIRMGTVKTTVDISDSLLREARAVAAREGVTLRGLIERGLHQVIRESASGTAFKLRRASFKGKGLQPGFENASWEQIRDAIYWGRGT
jgi:hypothetical protein